ncbi:MAG: hypothetical protein A2167_04410 [Planctomycetes bacterium RBG_13_46_10]|nr:MAG: hypothetical protein A2167_04410 [Planctomycetes bacterium RBG_13_46_10]
MLFVDSEFNRIINLSGGNKKMKKIVVISVMAAACLEMAGMVKSVQPVLPPKLSLEPFVSLSFTPDKIDLGNVSPVGFKNMPVKLQAHILANCPHQVKASFEPFKNKNSNVSIRPEHTSVEINGRDIPMTGSGVSILSSARPTPPEGVKVPVDIKFSARGLLLYPAGPYKGSIVLTITTRP